MPYLNSHLRSYDRPLMPTGGHPAWHRSAVPTTAVQDQTRRPLSSPRPHHLSDTITICSQDTKEWHLPVTFSNALKTLPQWITCIKHRKNNKFRGFQNTCNTQDMLCFSFIKWRLVRWILTANSTRDSSSLCEGILEDRFRKYVLSPYWYWYHFMHKSMLFAYWTCICDTNSISNSCRFPN